MPDSINDMIANNVGLIYAQLNKFNLSMDQDAESIGYGALHNAVVSYDSGKGVKFSTYATVCIYNALGSYIRTLNKKRQLDVVSYNAPSSIDGEVGHEYLESIPAKQNTEQDYIEAELHAHVRTAVQELYDSLTNNTQKAILAAWRDSEYSATLVSIAKSVGVSQPYVSKVLSSFKKDLRKRLEEHYYD